MVSVFLLFRRLLRDFKILSQIFLFCSFISLNLFPVIIFSIIFSYFINRVKKLSHYFSLQISSLFNKNTNKAKFDSTCIASYPIL